MRGNKLVFDGVVTVIGVRVRRRRNVWRRFYLRNHIWLWGHWLRRNRRRRWEDEHRYHNQSQMWYVRLLLESRWREERRWKFGIAFWCLSVWEGSLIVWISDLISLLLLLLLYERSVDAVSMKNFIERFSQALYFPCSRWVVVCWYDDLDISIPGQKQTAGTRFCPSSPIFGWSKAIVGIN